MSVRRSLLVLTIVMLVFPILTFGVQAAQQRSAASQNRLQTLQLYRVQKGNVKVTVSAIGTLQADQEVNLSFATAGRVAEVLVQPGDEVLANDPLVRMDDETQRIAYDQASLALQKAQLSAEKLLQPVSDDDIRTAQAAVDSAWGTYLSLANAVSDEDIQAADLSYQQAYQAWQDAQRIYGENPSNEMLRAKEGEASFDAEIARLKAEALKNSRGPQLGAAYQRVLQAKSELDRVKAGPTSAEVDQANIAVEQAQAQLDRTQSAYQQMTLVAPFDGVVSAVNVEPGALVAPGVAVVELTDISPLRLTVQVDEIDIGQVHAGVPATVQLDALPGVQLSAKLDDIALVGSNNNGVVSYDAHLTLEDSDPRARVGMTAEASFLVQESDRVLVIPNIYIRLDSKTNQAFVNVLNSENKLHEVEVKLGLRGQDSSEVLSGLSEGDLIGIDLSGDRFALFGS